MKTIKERHFIIEYVIPDSGEEEKEIKKIIHEVEEEDVQIDLSDYVMEKPFDSPNMT